VWGNGGDGLGIVDRCTGLAAEIGPRTLIVGSLAFSPDGRLFAFADYLLNGKIHSGLYELDLTGGAPRYVGLVDTIPSTSAYGLTAVWGADFDAEGNLYAIGYKGLMRVDPTTATATVIGLSQAVSTIDTIAFDPEGRLLGSGHDRSVFMLFEIDKATGVVSNVRQLNGNSSQGLGFSFACGDSGTLPPGSPQWILVTSSVDHACALDSGGKAYCWGQNNAGQLGVGDAVDHDVPTPVSPPSGSSAPLSFATISAGQTHNCGIATGGSTYCWGSNDFGQLGNGTTSFPSMPTAVLGSNAFLQVFAGGTHTCALDAAQQAYCWGRGAEGQLGNGSNTQSATPVAVTPPYAGAQFALITSGGNHSCAIARTGDAYCWGQNDMGQLGDGNGGPGVQQSVPVAVSGGHKFKWLSAGLWHTCGITTSDETVCWGGSDFAGLASGSTTACQPERCTRNPTPVQANVKFARVWAGATHTCGLIPSGLAYCWGRGTSGELGSGQSQGACLPPSSAETCSYAPVPVFGGSVYQGLAAGQAVTIAVKANGTAYRWGGQRAVGSPLMPNDRPAIIPSP